jgi:peptidoglycan hydrolase-like protein with peptidoglycan-binding domain
MYRATGYIALTLALVVGTPAMVPAADKPSASDDKSSGKTVRDKVEGASDALAREHKNADRDPVKGAQRALKERGYDIGEPDGKLGAKTHAAVRAFQKDEGLKVTGRLDPETMKRLRAGKQESRPSASPR